MKGGSHIWYILRVIPQRTVDNNLGPDRLAGPKDPNYCRHRASDIAAVGATFNVFSYDAVLGRELNP